jgi:hypothetical protein
LTLGGSPVREICTPGSVRGAARKGRPYRAHLLFGRPNNKCLPRSEQMRARRLPVRRGDLFALKKISQPAEPT